MIIGAAVGGSIGAILLLILVLVILALCVKSRRGKNHYNLAKSTKIELGTMNPSKPIIGSKKSDILVVNTSTHFYPSFLLINMNIHVHIHIIYIIVLYSS